MTDKTGETLPVTLVTGDDLTLMLQAGSERRRKFVVWIGKELKEGIDFGKITGQSAAGKEFKSSKPSLWQPGAQKILDYTGCRVEFHRDLETWEMAGSPNGLFCYRCIVLARTNGEVLGEGRGAASIGEKKWPPHTAIKMAEKRAQVDAALRTFGLAESFTQDIDEDQELGTSAPPPERKRKPISGMPNNVDVQRRVIDLLDQYLTYQRVDAGHPEMQREDAVELFQAWAADVLGVSLEGIVKRQSGQWTTDWVDALEEWVKLYQFSGKGKGDAHA